MNKNLTLILLISLVAVLGTYYLTYSGKEILRISTTTSLEDTGLLEELEAKFEKKYPNIDIQIVSGGTGIAIERGKMGDADLLIVHDKEREEEFIKEGYGTERYPFAYNYFYIVGPKDDPANIKGTKRATEAFQKIFTKAQRNPQVKFVSRGDNSGTHAKEMKIWNKTGHYTIIKEKPWYIETGSGMADTLKVADEKQAYTITDSGTYLAYKDKLNLTVYIKDDNELLNVYSAIPINPKKIKSVNYDAAMKFINFLLSKEGQDIIAKYGKDKYGEPLFIPWKIRPTNLDHD
ncbi:MAG: extracellular solute-binding protein [Methanothermobacter sp.]|nr:extracellular solute-binding protein [Methanothermobacter sp.]